MVGNTCIINVVKRTPDIKQKDKKSDLITGLVTYIALALGYP